MSATPNSFDHYATDVTDSFSGGWWATAKVDITVGGRFDRGAALVWAYVRRW